MQSAQRAQFLAVNYSRLQGLKGFPIGLLLLVTVLWANTPTIDRNWVLLFMVAVLSLALHIGVDRYYASRYGIVERKPRQKQMDYAAAVLGGLAGLVAFLAEITYDLSFSPVGLVFAAAALFEYFRIVQVGKHAFYRWLMLLSFLVILAASLLPLVGLGHLWQSLGLRSSLLGILLVTSLVMLVTSLFGHLYFARQFPSEES